MSGGRRKEEPSQPQLANGALKVSVWSKVLRSDAAWEDKVLWGLAGAHVRGPGWDSGTKGQARTSSCPCPGPGPVVFRVAQGCRGELRGSSCQARGSSQSWSKSEIAWVTREPARRGGGVVLPGRSRA